MTVSRTPQLRLVANVAHSLGLIVALPANRLDKATLARLEALLAARDPRLLRISGLNTTASGWLRAGWCLPGSTTHRHQMTPKQQPADRCVV